MTTHLIEPSAVSFLCCLLMFRLNLDADDCTLLCKGRIHGHETMKRICSKLNVAVLVLVFDDDYSFGQVDQQRTINQQFLTSDRHPVYLYICTHHDDVIYYVMSALPDISAKLTMLLKRKSIT